MNSLFVWTIAGSDGSGGAGLQADLKTFHDFKVPAASVITAITLQNSLGVQAVHSVSSECLEQQLEVLSSDLPAEVIKLGMQGDVSIVAEFLESYPGIVIVDPVIDASSGHRLLSDLPMFIQKIIPRADLLTPNLLEATLLTGVEITDFASMRRAAALLLEKGAKRVYVKGGHFQETFFCQDYYTDGERSFWLSQRRIKTPHTHGSGCTFSAAVASALALDYDWLDALVIAKMYVQQGIRLAVPMGSGVGSVAHAGFPEEGQDFPYVSDEPLRQQPKSFLSCGEAIGLYPIVDSHECVLRAAKAGATTVQLRIKSGDASRIEEEIALSVASLHSYSCRLFINDYWALAVKYGAYGVHLGQEDLLTADLAAIHSAGLRLGVSTHSFYEVARAHAIHPSYLACGPIFETNSKIMPFLPQGLERLLYWQNVLPYPWVAIGGISEATIDFVAETGVSGIAMISAVAEPEKLEAMLARISR